VVAVGDGGAILRSSNPTSCGAAAGYRPVPNSLWSAGAGPTLFDVGVGYAVGAGGVAVRIDDAGGVTRVPTGTTADLFGVGVASNSPTSAEATACGCNTVYMDVDAVGAGGTIVRGRAQNGPVAVMAPEPRRTGRDLHDVAVQQGSTASNFRVTAVGDAGIVLSDPAGTGQWTTSFTGSCEILNGIRKDSFSAPAMAVGSHGAVFTDLSGGQTADPGCGPAARLGRYGLVGADGGAFTFGDFPFQGSAADRHLNAPILGAAADPSDGDGYWLLGRDGGVFAFAAPFLGSLAGHPLTATPVAIEPLPTGGGYWIVLANGTVDAFGDAPALGSLAGRLNAPIVSMAATPTGRGYWLVGADGGVFSFGDAAFFGSLGDLRLNGPIVDVAAVPDGAGYWLVGRDGGVFSFGAATFLGSTGDRRLNAPIVGIAADRSGEGYWLGASDGGVFSFGRAVFAGSAGGMRLASPIVDLVR
jgi:hypothetical protein